MTIQLFGIYFHILELPFILFLVAAVPVRMLSTGLSIRLVGRKYALLLLGLLVAYIATVQLSAVHAVDTAMVFKSVLKWLEVLAVTVLVFFYISDQKQVKHIFYFLLIFNLSQVAFVYFQVISGQYSLLAYRIFPSYQSVLAFALLLPVCLKSRSKFFWGLLLATLVAVLLSLSRGSYLSAFVVTLYTLTRSQNKKRLFFYVAFAAALVFILIAATDDEVFSRWSLFFSMDLGSNRERLALLILGIKTFMQNPIFGIGSLNFPIYYQKKGIPFDVPADRFQLPNPHNTFVQIGAEEGIFALLFFSALIFLVFYLLRLFRHRRVIADFYLTGLQNFYIVLLITLFFGFIAFQNRLNLAILFGICLGLLRLAPAHKQGTKT